MNLIIIINFVVYHKHYKGYNSFNANITFMKLYHLMQIKDDISFNIDIVVV